MNTDFRKYKKLNSLAKWVDQIIEKIDPEEEREWTEFETGAGLQKQFKEGEPADDGLKRIFFLDRSQMIPDENGEIDFINLEITLRKILVKPDGTIVHDK